MTIIPNEILNFCEKADQEIERRKQIQKQRNKERREKINKLVKNGVPKDIAAIMVKAGVR